MLEGDCTNHKIQSGSPNADNILARGMHHNLLNRKKEYCGVSIKHPLCRLSRLLLRLGLLVPLFRRPIPPPSAQCLDGLG
jgi:hypothetical protein